MTLDEFNAAADQTRITPRPRHAAQLVLVEKMRPVNAAKLTGMTRQQVEQNVKKILMRYHQTIGIPSGWECVTVCVPPDKAADIQEIADKALHEYLAESR